MGFAGLWEASPPQLDTQDRGVPDMPQMPCENDVNLEGVMDVPVRVNNVNTKQTHNSPVSTGLREPERAL